MPFQIANEIAAVKILAGGLDIFFFITDEPKFPSASISSQRSWQSPCVAFKFVLLLFSWFMEEQQIDRYT